MNKIYEYDFSYAIWVGCYPNSYPLNSKYFYLIAIDETKFYDVSWTILTMNGIEIIYGLSKYTIPKAFKEIT